MQQHSPAGEGKEVGHSWDRDFSDLVSPLDSLQVGPPLLLLHCLQTGQTVMSSGALQIVRGNAQGTQAGHHDVQQLVRESSFISNACRSKAAPMRGA